MRKIFIELKFGHVGIGDPVFLRRFGNSKRYNENNHEIGEGGKTNQFSKYFV